MGADDILHLGQSTAWMVVLVSAPPLLVAGAVGLTVGLFQTLTQIQDAAFAFVFKIAAVTAVLIAASGWLGGQLLDFNTQMLESFPTATR